LNYSSYNSW